MTILFLNAFKMEETPPTGLVNCPQIEKNPEPSIEEFGGFAKNRKNSLRVFFCSIVFTMFSSTHVLFLVAKL